jgi:hypothetical protein
MGLLAAVNVVRFQHSIVLHVHGGPVAANDFAEFIRTMDGYWPLWIHYLADDALQTVALALCEGASATETADNIEQWLQENQNTLPAFYKSSGILDTDLTDRVIHHARAVLAPWLGHHH